MKKLLETSLGKGNRTAFLRDGKKISWREAMRYISKSCNHPYVIKHVPDGVIVHMSNKEYEETMEMSENYKKAKEEIKKLKRKNIELRTF